MILKESRELEWIQQLRIRYPYTNPTLIEKAIRAFSLLEALAVSGCPFVFKGGTALMLHMNSAKRISIDVDIICEPGTNVIGYLNKTAQEYGFGEVVSGERVSRTNVPKTHANPSSRPRPPRLQPAPRLRTKPPTHPPKLKQKRANCILPYS